MKTPTLSTPRRWVHAPPEELDAQTAAAAELLRGALPCPPLPEARVERIARELEARRSPRHRRNAGWRRALAVGMVLGAPLAYALWQGLAVRWATQGEPPTGPRPSAPAVAPSTHPQRDESPPPVPTGASQPFGEGLDLRTVPAGSPPPRPAERRTREEPAGQPREPRGPSTGSSLEKETQLLGQANRELGAGDARGSLATLERYSEEFPRGHFTDEALALRIRALVGSRQRAEALALLGPMDHTAVTRLPRGDELALLRAELLAEAGRFSEALDAFDALFESRLVSVREAALFQRAGCKARGGDVAGARADDALYLELFPQGRFHREVSRRLGDRR